MPYFLSIVIAQFVGGFGAIFTSSKIPTWYAALAKPTWTPPGWAFGPIWTTLYVLMAIAAARIWMVRNVVASARTALTLYAVQLTLNALWSVLFFGMQAPGLALIEIVMLWVAIVATMLAFWRIDTIAGVLMIPYIIWVSIATSLNYGIFVLN